LATVLLGSSLALGVGDASSNDGTLDGLNRYVTEFGLSEWHLPATIESFPAPDGAVLRYARWARAADAPAQGTVVHFNGRTEFIERNIKTYSDLADRGWEIWTLDWRGQGLSHRPLAGEYAIRGHIDDFATYVSDAKHYIDTVVKLQERPGKRVLLAHSMGGQIALRYLIERPGDFNLVVMSSPLVRLPSDWKGEVAIFLKDVLGKIEAGTRSCILRRSPDWQDSFVGSACSALARPDSGKLDNAEETHKYTHDTKNLATAECLIERNLVSDRAPGFAVTCPTGGWLVAADNSTDKVFKRREELTMPILMVAAKDDTAVDPDGQKDLCGALDNCTLVQVPAAGHELLIETQDIRAAFLSCFDEFAADPEDGDARCRPIVDALAAD
jgi:lysophospholipase